MRNISAFRHTYSGRAQVFVISLFYRTKSLILKWMVLIDMYKKSSLKLDIQARTDFLGSFLRLETSRTWEILNYFRTDKISH